MLSYRRELRSCSFRQDGLARASVRETSNGQVHAFFCYAIKFNKHNKNKSMKHFTWNGLCLTAMFMLLCCLSVHADDGLITKQLVIKLEKAGTLPDKIGTTRKNQITNLKIVGEVNGTDWRLIREMAGGNYTFSPEGNLAILDLSEAKVVEGGRDYYYGWNNGNDQLGGNAFLGCRNLKSLILPPDIISIGSNAFEGCSGLTSLVLPSGITTISYSAFKDCSSLTSLTLPSSITTIDEYAFEGCKSLTGLDLPSGVNTIKESAFEGCSGLTTLTLPSGITTISYSAFKDCSGLTSVTLPSGVTTIEKYAFEGCGSLTSFIIPSSITTIKDGAFTDCHGLTSIHVYTGIVPKMGSDVFKGCDAKNCKVYVPKGTYDDYWLSEFGYFDNIEEVEATGLEKIVTSTDVKEVSRYSVNGQRLSAPTKGLNLVKYSDGSVKKVAVQ